MGWFKENIPKTEEEIIKEDEEFLQQEHEIEATI